MPVIVMFGSFIAARFLAVNIIIIVLVCGVIGAADIRYQEKIRGADDKR